MKLSALPPPQQGISEINDEAEELPDKKHRIAADDGIAKDHERADDTENPESDRQDRLFFLFRKKPLENKAKGKNSLADQPPKHKGKGNILVADDLLQVVGLTAHQPADGQDREGDNQGLNDGWNFFPETMIIQVTDINTVGNRLAEENGQVMAKNAVEDEEKRGEDA